MTEAKDPNYVAKVEKAVSEKYGKDAVVNPRSTWNEEKEKKHAEASEKFYEEKLKNREKITQSTPAFTIRESKILANYRIKNECPVCGNYKTKPEEDLYLNRFGCCFDCYIQHIEGREERWASGWRPNK